MMKLSIIIPVYNEEKTIAQIIKRVLKVKLSAEKEIIIVNDGSTDMSASIITQMDLPLKAKVKIIHHKKNQGKGAAVITGMQKASGQYIVIQDADLEYDPVDIIKLLALLEKNKGHVIYGTRLKRFPDLKRDEKTPLFLIHYLGNKVLSFTTSILYSTWITDMECCYKLFPREALKDIHLQAKGFEFEPEITAKLLKKGYKIKETPISTNPRSHKEGKKLHAFHDGKKALWTLLKYKFMD
jgi:dolichol-phosphate mannosyltransferase